MAYELKGKVKLLQETQTFGSGFQKREIVVRVEEGKYPQDINLEFVQEKIALLDSVEAGDEVSVMFDIRGREYNGRYFNNLQGWKITKEQAGSLVKKRLHLPMCLLILMILKMISHFNGERRERIK